MRKIRTDRLLIRTAESGDYCNIRDFLIESSHLYPGIELWWEKNVRPGIELGNRVVLVVDAGNSLEGLFIGKLSKPGGSAKMCTLRLRESVRNRGIGRSLTTEGLCRLFVGTPDGFHVTVSEAAEEGSISFFESIGFRRIAVERNRYRRGVDEFIYSCPRDEMLEVINNDLSKGIDRSLFGVIPKEIPSEQTLLMSLKPDFAKLILNGRKTIEFRRKFSKKYTGATILFYISHPVRQFMFTAKVARVDHAQKGQLWDLCQAGGGISETIFYDYFSGTTTGYAIHLSDLKPVSNQLVFNQAKRICPQLRAPQSFQKLNAESPLLHALNLPVHI